MKKCPYCNAEIEENARFCIYCMSSLDEKQIVKEEKTRKNAAVISVISAILVFAIICTSLLFTNIDNPFTTSLNSNTNASSHNTDSSFQENSHEGFKSNEIQNQTASSDIHLIEDVSSHTTTANSSSQSSSEPSHSTTSSSTLSTTSTSSISLSTPSSSSSQVTGTSSSSQNTSSDNLIDETTYTYSIVDSKAILTDVNSGLSGEVVIPSSFDGYPLYAIGEKAFFMCGQLTKVTIPKGVTEIRGNAFRDCNNLKTVIINEGVTSIGDFAFYASEKIETIQLPNTLKSIGHGAFMGCWALKSITIPNGVTTISHNAFQHCVSLETIEIPDTVTQMLYGVFNSCKKLKTVTIGSGVTFVTGFYDCSALETIIIREGPTKLISDLMKCENIKNIYLPKSIINVEGNTLITYSGVNIWYAGTAEDKAKIVTSASNDGLINNATWHYNSKY